MHIECFKCKALFDEETNTRCPRCQTPADEIMPGCGGCGGCGNERACGGCLGCGIHAHLVNQ
ncbi:MAG: hypothetical protein ACOX1R_03250 [Caldicoprobacterales bacterium]|nr:hypothetical protein [Clostridiales bacterium]